MIEAVKHQSDIGLLGIDLSNRRRNRLSTQVRETEGGLISLDVKQAFGNCPQYIQTREIEQLPSWSATNVKREEFSEPGSKNHQAKGADVSHRGGQPGFVRVDGDNRLVIPDYPGNNHFNTLGNIEANGRAGLTFINFSTGNILMLSGSAEILWGSTEGEFFEGSERLWAFNLEQGFRLTNAINFRFQFDSFSPNSLLTDTWQTANAKQEAEQKRLEWLPYKVAEIVDETAEIKSFYLESTEHTQFRSQAGQYLTIKVDQEKESLIRTYTVSSAPDDPRLRISIKREETGTVSKYMHDELKLGDTLLARAPMGDFTLVDHKPAVFVAAGIGITPMIAMIRQRFFNAVKHRNAEPMVLFYQARRAELLAFTNELAMLQNQLGSILRIVTILSDPETELIEGVDYDYGGHLHEDMFRAELGFNNYQFYLCGPGGFIQTAYDNLMALDVRDSAISAESFGPSSLVREAKRESSTDKVADTAVIEFSKSGFEQGWKQEDGNLLQFAESHGLNPEFSCRSGNCGSCAVKLESGSVVYPDTPSFPVGGDEVLLCCAVPAKGQVKPVRLMM